MEKDFRSQFKATPIKKLKKHVEDDNTLFGASNNEYLNLEDGKSVKIRIFPPHPGKENFYVAKKCYWLSFAKRDGDMGRGAINDSRLHGGTKMDVVEEYSKMATKFCAKDSDKLDAISGDKDSLKPTYSWMAYASKVSSDEELHPMLWEFKKMVRDAMNKLAFSEEDDDAIEIDPFTDPDEGLPILVKYLKSPNRKKGENYYETSFPKKNIAYPLTDEVLEAFMALKPLDEIIGKYNMRDFDRAVEGLQNFDETNEIGLFENEAWIEKLEEIRSQYDAVEEAEEDKAPAKKLVKKTVEKETAKPAAKKKVVDDEEEEAPVKKSVKKKAGDEFDDMDREELKEYIAENELDVRVKKSFEDDEIRELIREAIIATASDNAPETTNDEFDDMDRETLKEYIAENDLDVRVKKSMVDEEIREAIREAIGGEGDAPEPDVEEPEEVKPKAKMSLKDIQDKLAKSK